MEQGKSSISRKRARWSSPPPPPPFDADDIMEAGAADEQRLPEEEFSHDDRPISTVVRQGSTTSTAPAPAPTESPSAPEPTESPPPELSSFSDSSTMIRNVTVDNSSAFGCTICYLPLKAPIFQCTVGHMVCFPCHDKLGQATRCHVCRVPIPDGYSRCNAMEQVVNSIRVRCPHAVHGCAESPAYHDRDNHSRTCAFKPCQCPGEGCGFAGPLRTTLLEHFAAAHGWPFIAGNIGLPGFKVHLRKGFNVVLTTGATTEQQYTLVLNVEQASLVRDAITAFCIHPCSTGNVRIRLSYYYRSKSYLDGVCSWSRGSEAPKVVCTDLSNGIPSCSLFHVPMLSATEEGEHKDIRLMVHHDCDT